jgi:uncharacterized membrane protein YoaK (UPF0700 family)
VIYYIPLLIAFILGVLYGRHVVRIDHPLIILTAGLFLALMLGAFPFYGFMYSSLPVSLSGVYISALIGVVVGSTTRGEKSNTPP